MKNDAILRKIDEFVSISIHIRINSRNKIRSQCTRFQLDAIDIIFCLEMMSIYSMCIFLELHDGRDDDNDKQRRKVNKRNMSKSKCLRYVKKRIHICVSEFTHGLQYTLFEYKLVAWMPWYIRSNNFVIHTICCVNIYFGYIQAKPLSMYFWPIDRSRICQSNECVQFDK